MTRPKPSPSPTVEPTAAPPAPSPYADLLTLARESADRAAFLAAAVERLRREFDAPYAALHARLGAAVVQEEAHYGPGDPRFWRRPVQQFLTEELARGTPRARLLTARSANLRLALLGAPLADPAGQVEGAVALVVAGDAGRVPLLVQKLTALTGLVAAAVPLADGDGGRDADVRGPAQALSRAANLSSPTELAFALTNSLRNRLACRQVALGVVRGQRVRVVAISGLDHVAPRSPGVAVLRAALEECLDHGAPLVSQRDDDWTDAPLEGGHRLLRQWRAAAGGDTVATFPLFAGPRCVAVLGLRRGPDQPLRREQVAQIQRLIEPFGPALSLLQQAHRGLAAHAADRLRAAWRSLTGPGSRGRRLAALAGLAAAAWFVFGTLDYEVVVPARVMPAVQRQLAMPFEGRLARVAVTAGDTVRAGDELCALDSAELELERARLVAQRAVCEREQTRAQAAGDEAAAAIAAANRHLADVQLAIAERRLTETVVRAPFDGVVLRGDLRPLVGGRLAQGALLFEVAPAGAWALELDAPQRVLRDVHPGLRGTFAPAARPEQPQEFILARIGASAEVRAGQNVYRLEGPLTTPPDWLRPGMEGVARIHVGPRRVWWVTLHRMVDWLRLHLWL